MDARALATGQSPVTHCTEDQVVHWKTGLLSAQGAINKKKIKVHLSLGDSDRSMLHEGRIRTVSSAGYSIVPK